MSASACKPSPRSITRRPTQSSCGRRAGRSSRKTFRTPRSSASASAMNGTAGCGSTLPVNIAQRRDSRRPAATPISAAAHTCFDINTGNFSSAVFLANAYIDLGTWWCITPFIGAGVGGARNMISDVQDQGIIGSNGSVGFGYTFNDSSQWNLAWDVQAGLTYNVNDNFKVDFSWRYPQSRLAADRRRALSEHADLSGRVLHAARHHLAGFPCRPALGVPRRRRLRSGVVRAAGLCRPAAAIVPAPQPQYVPAPPPQYVPGPPQQYMPMQPPVSSRG